MVVSRALGHPVWQRPRIVAFCVTPRLPPAAAGQQGMAEQYHGDNGKRAHSLYEQRLELIPVSRRSTQIINLAVGGRYFPPRSAVTSPAALHHHPLTSTKLYCWRQRHTCTGSLHGNKTAGSRIGDISTLSPLHHLPPHKISLYCII